MEINLRKIVSYIAVSTIIFTNTAVYANENDNSEETEVHIGDKAVETTKPEETEEQVKEPEGIEVQLEEKQETIEEVPLLAKKFVNSSKKYTLAQIEKDIKNISNHYSQITSVEVIGNSYEGKPINAIKLSLPSQTCDLLLNKSRRGSTTK